MSDYKFKGDNRLVVPSWFYDQVAMYGMTTEGLLRVPVRRDKDEIDPAKLNYPWKGHPV